MAAAAIAGAIVWLTSAAAAHAHEGMAGPGEIGPPLLTSVALGFVCYWLVILWPSSKNDGDAPNKTMARSNKNRPRKKRPAKAGEAQDAPRFTKLAGRSRS
jgi:hypothetical protein